MTYLDDPQAEQWKAYYDRQVENGTCPYSGQAIVMCHLTDLCDCFDFPEEGPLNHE